MSRTYRNLDGMNRCALRNPKTENERKQLDGFLQDVVTEDYPFSGVNHARKRLSTVPTAWDDKVVSGYEQQDYKAS